MNIGFVSVWFERGAGYVTKLYMDMLSDDNKLFVYSRAGEIVSPTEGWNQDYVTWGKVLPFTRIQWPHFRKWIIDNKLDVVFFNEQRDFRIVCKCKLEFPNLKLGSYIDYYTAELVPKFKYFDFLICNTLRHQSVFTWHPQSYYVPWGTDTNVYAPKGEIKLVDSKKVTFFHSAGMSNRKGTDVLIKVFKETDLHNKAKLIIHSQVSSTFFTDLSEDELKKYNITFVDKTVSAPGLYYLGDVYVYPTTLDGLGLTMYEALSCGLPLIVPDNAPMNEIVDEDVGRLVKVDLYRSREDGYYWPLCFVNEADLYKAMNEFATDISKTIEMKYRARKRAEDKLDLFTRKDSIKNIFYNSKIQEFSEGELNNMIKFEKKKYFTLGRMNLEMVLPANLVDFVEKVNLKSHER